MNQLLRRVVVAGLTGALTVAVAWAGAGLAPVRTPRTPDPVKAKAGAKASKGARPADVSVRSAQQSAAAAAPKVPPPAGSVLAGAAKVSIEPQPGEGETWAKEGCRTFGEDAAQGLMHVADFRVKWPENPNCIYMGGYGLGPMNPITSWEDPYGLWVRSVAIGDGTDTVVLTILDGTSFFGKYSSMCDGCGAFDLADSLGEELGINPAGFMFASTHSHTSPDFIGGWGGVPDWYMTQVTEAMKTSVRDAVASMRPAVVESGETQARAFNGERRDFYRSAEEQGLTWLRLVDTADAKKWSKASTIATVAAYGAHPVTADEGPGIADADFPAVFDKMVEDKFGGVGLFFQTGLGNLSPRGNKVEMGGGLAAMVPPVGTGTIVSNPDVKVARSLWDQPVTNSGLTALGTPGFFDRPFAQKPAVVEAGKNGNRKCRSASPVSVNTGVSAAKIGSVWITGAPGEVFSNLTNTIKERNPNGVTLPLAQVNDGLGYIMQFFETDHAGRQVLGFVGDPLAEYEDAYSIDACFGEKVLETSIGLLGGM